MATPIGVTNNNPLNLRPTQPPFEGTLRTVHTSAGDFTVFQSAAFGFRAACRNLISYYDRLGIKTVRGVIERWAPSAENDTAAYVAAVCNRTGFQADQPLELKSYEVAYNLLHAMTIQEQGSFDAYFKQWQLDEGLRRAGIADVPPTPLHKRITAIGGTVAAAATAAPQIQSAVAQYAPDVASSPSVTLKALWHVAAFIGGALAIYGSIQLARKQGV